MDWLQNSTVRPVSVGDLASLINRAAYVWNKITTEITYQIHVHWGIIIDVYQTWDFFKQCTVIFYIR